MKSMLSSMVWAVLFTVFFGFQSSINCLGSDISLGEKGVIIKTKGMGDFELAYPKMLLNDTDFQGQEAKEKKVTSGKAVLKYANGAEIVIEKKKGGFTIEGSGDIFAYKMEMLINFDYSKGGKWQVGNGETQLFPKEKPEKPHLYQGNNSSFKLISAKGKELSFSLPEFSFQQLQDSREWNWEIFQWFFQVPFNKDTPKASVSISGK